MENKTKKVEIEIPEGKIVKWINGVLTLVNDKPQDVTERIKTFEDACYELGDEHQFVKDYRILAVGNRISDDLYAYFKLRIITAALNEGWEPQFTKGECRWYFWYDLITKEQYDELSDKDKSRVVYRGNSHAIASYDWSYSSTNVGSRLAFKSKKLAEYASRQFAEIYADFCFRPKSEEKG